MSENEISQIMRALGRIEGNLERIIPLVDKHEKSIDTLTQNESYQKGQSARLSAIIAFVVSTVASFATKFFK